MVGRKLSAAKFVRSHLEVFLGGGSYENPGESQVGGIVSGARLCHLHERNYD
jgi:hypothetical protein